MNFRLIYVKGLINYYSGGILLKDNVILRKIITVYERVPWATNRGTSDTYIYIFFQLKSSL